MSRVARQRKWMLGACAIALGSLGAGAAQAAASVALPPDTQSAPVARHIIYNGLDMHATVFQSSLSQGQVVDFYKQRWGKAIAINDLQASKIVGHLEGDDYVTVQVSADGSGSKGTIGVVRLPPKGAPRPELGKGLPQPSGARVVNDIAYPDDRTPARTVLMTDALSPAQNAQWFRSRLLVGGWKQAGEDRCAHGAAHCVLQFERGKSRMMLVAARGQGRSEVLMNVMNPTLGD